MVKIKRGDITKISELFKTIFTRGPTQKAKELSFDEMAQEIIAAYQDVYIRELAFWSAVNIIANALGACEFKTYKRGKEVKAEEYWTWNFTPNSNQNASMFWHKLIGQLYRHNEALVIERAGQLLVADSFTKTHNAVREDVFSNIEVEELTINRSFRSSEVLFFRLNHVDMRPLLNSLHASHATLINAAQKGYRWSTGQHGVLDISSVKAGDTDGKWIETYNQIVGKFIKPYLESSNGILPMFEGYKFTGENSQKSQETTRDIRALIDDVYEFTAKAFGIPVALMKGDIAGTKEATNNLLTFCIDPLCDQIQKEITSKRYGYENFARGSFIRIDTSTIKHFDMFEMAASVDKLISSGVYCINDILIATGKEPIDVPWAWQHWITKNYIEIENMNQLGGDTN